MTVLNFKFVILCMIAFTALCVIVHEHWIFDAGSDHGKEPLNKKETRDTIESHGLVHAITTVKEKELRGNQKSNSIKEVADKVKFISMEEVPEEFKPNTDVDKGENDETVKELNDHVNTNIYAVNDIKRSNTDKELGTKIEFEKGKEVSVNTMGEIHQYYSETRDELFRSGFFSTAKNISEKSEAVLLSLVNDAYLSFTFSWLCNTKNMDVHESLIILTTSNTSRDKITHKWPNIHVFAINIGVSNGRQAFNTAGYLKMMIERTKILMSILNEGVNIFLIEFDSVWLESPLMYMKNISNVDMLVSLDSGQVSGGFLYLVATNRTKALWYRLTELMIGLGNRIKKSRGRIPETEIRNDQDLLSELILKRYGNVRTKKMSPDLFENGKWYFPLFQRTKKTRPITIQNNWIRGHDSKIRRAKQWNHWFLRNNGSCDFELVNRIAGSK